MAWTSPRTWVVGEIVTASQMNTHVRDNLSYLKDVFDGNVSQTITFDGDLNIVNGNIILDNTQFINAKDSGGSIDQMFQYAGNDNMIIGFGVAGGKDVRISPGGGAKLTITGGGFVGINTNSNSEMTQGLTIDQGANDDEILALKSSDVAHGVTDQTETDTFLKAEKLSAANGGATFSGFTESVIGLDMVGVATTGVTGKGTSSFGPVSVNAFKKSGTGMTIMGANENIFVVREGNATRFIVDEDGDVHVDGSGTLSTFDEYDDAALVRAFDREMGPGQVIRSEFDEFVNYNRADLEAAGIVTFNEDDHHFVNITQLQRLHNGAIWQQEMKLRRLEARVERYEQALIELGAMPAQLPAELDTECVRD